MLRRSFLLLSFWITPFCFSLHLHTPAIVDSKEDILSKSELTLENVYAALVLNKIKHPEIVMRQIIVETMWLRCENCSKEMNNLFGFYANGKYMEFENWYASVKYYKKWQERYYKGGDYYKFLVKIGYATSHNYTRNLKGVILPELAS